MAQHHSAIDVESLKRCTPLPAGFDNEGVAGFRGSRGRSANPARLGVCHQPADRHQCSPWPLRPRLRSASPQFGPQQGPFRYRPDPGELLKRRKWLKRPDEGRPHRDRVLGRAPCGPSGLLRRRFGRTPHRSVLIQPSDRTLHPSVARHRGRLQQPTLSRAIHGRGDPGGD